MDTGSGGTGNELILSSAEFFDCPYRWLPSFYCERFIDSIKIK